MRGVCGLPAAAESYDTRSTGMAERGGCAILETLPVEIRESLAELELELSEGKSVQPIRSLQYPACYGTL